MVVGFGSNYGRLTGLFSTGRLLLIPLSFPYYQLPAVGDGPHVLHFDETFPSGRFLFWAAFPPFFLTFLSITAIHFFLFDFFDLSNSAPPDVSVAICSAHIIPLEETHSCFLNCRRSSLLLIFLSLCYGRRPPVVGIAIPAVVASQSCCLAKIFEGRKGEEEDGSLLVARAASKPIRIRNQSVEGWPSVVSSRMEPICQTICC